MTEREVTIVKAQSTEAACLIVESIGGDYLGYPWRMPESLVIHYMKNKIEKYFVKIDDRKVKLIIGSYENKERLQLEGNTSWPQKIIK